MASHEHRLIGTYIRFSYGEALLSTQKQVHDTFYKDRAVFYPTVP